MNFLGLFSRKANSVETDNMLKIYFDEELHQYKNVGVDPYSTGETILETLRGFPDIARMIEHIKNFNIDKMSLILIVKHAKKKYTLSKRRINPFELISEIIKTKEKDQEFVWMFRIDTDKGALFDKKPTRQSSMLMADSKTAQGGDQFMEREKFERSGVLLKRSKRGDYKEKKFILYKESLIFYNVKDKEKKVTYIPLVLARAEKASSQEKNVFEIKTTDKMYFLKAKSTEDMKGWIWAINMQAGMVTENNVIQNIDLEIQEIEEKYEKTMEQEIKSLFVNFEKTIKNEKIIKLLFEYIKDDPLLVEFESFFMRVHAYTNVKKVSRSEYLQEAEALIKFIESEHEKYESDASGELKGTFTADFCENVCRKEMLEKIREEFKKIRAIEDPKNTEHLSLFLHIYENCVAKLKDFYFFFLRTDEMFHFKVVDIKNGFAEYINFPRPKLPFLNEPSGMNSEN